MINQEKAQAALIRAKSGNSLINYSKVISGFIAKGVNAAEIMPRENVLTYAAWPALGRQVKRGEHGVKVITWVDFIFDQSVAPSVLPKNLSALPFLIDIHERIGKIIQETEATLL